MKRDSVDGRWADGVLTLWVKDEFTKSMLNKGAVTEGLAKAAAARFGQCTRVVLAIGTAPAEATESAPQEDALDALMDFGKFDNITIE